MSPTSRPAAGGAALAAAFGLLWLLTGCSSDHPYRSAHRGPPPPPPPPLIGQANFFADQVTAEIETGAGFGSDRGGEGGEGSGGGGGHRGGGMHMGGGGHRGGRHGGGEGGDGGDTTPSDAIEQDQIANIRQAAAHASPAVMIHLRFTNHGPGHIDIDVTDFLSELGNFVVQPETLSLDAGQTVEVDPMTSRLAGPVAEASVTLALRANGRVERRTLALVLKNPPAAAPAQPPATPAPASGGP